MRTTVPHVLHPHGAVSIVDFHHSAKEGRRFIAESPSRRALSAAVAALTADDPNAAFSQAQVHVALAVLGHSWSSGTIGDLLNDEATAAAGRLLRVRRGLFRLRGKDQIALARGTRAPGPVREQVLAVLRELAAEGRKRVMGAEIAERLAASGLSYSPRAVRDGLQQLKQATPAVLAPGPQRGCWLILI